MRLCAAARCALVGDPFVTSPVVISSAQTSGGALLAVGGGVVTTEPACSGRVVDAEPRALFPPDAHALDAIATALTTAPNAIRRFTRLPFVAQ